MGYDRHFTIGVWVGRPDGTAVPGLIGRLVAAPILFDAYGRLNREPEALVQPPFTLQATTATLPPPLRHVRHDVPKTLAATIQAPLRIAYPLDGSRVELERRRRPRDGKPCAEGIRRCAAVDVDGRWSAGADRQPATGDHLES